MLLAALFLGFCIGGEIDMKLCRVLLVVLWSVASTAAEVVGGDPVSAEDCPLLSQDVVLRLSAGVSGAWACNDDAQTIKVATCSQYGSRKSINYLCAPVAVSVDGDVRYNYAGCEADPSSSVTLAGGRFFVSSSAFAAPTLVVLDALCGDSALTSLDFFSEN